MSSRPSAAPSVRMKLREIAQLRAAPNQLTLLRLCIIPFLVLAILDHDYQIAFWLFVLAGITDGLDGLLARWLQQRTVLGQYLDPMADKLLLSTLFLVLHHEGLISLRVTVLVFGRDLGIVMVGAILYASIGMKDFRPSLFGKANTLAQIIALLTVLLSQFYAPYLVLLVKHWSLAATVVFTVVSGFHYAWLMTRRLSGSTVTANN
ncbi:MAG TPA: CDP-alcohol phosphatidyltransferase family protein [Acidobacteriaceae bacterium]|nr:CDP-alcohol phosphatidyltransferase family protein [Acidobacteriaceae bacterium]